MQWGRVKAVCRALLRTLVSELIHDPESVDKLLANSFMLNGQKLYVCASFGLTAKKVFLSAPIQLGGGVCVYRRVLTVLLGNI